MEFFHERSIEYPHKMASRENQDYSIPSEPLLEAYRRGIFPMDVEGTLEWFSPDPRGILPIEQFHLPHTTRKAIHSGKWEIRIDTQFEAVMRHCANRSETWIDDHILNSYVRLHQLGHAHSIEAWTDGQLAGGLYGVRVGGAFFGESMFHVVPEASKVALAALIRILQVYALELLDIQWTTPHLEKFGAIAIRRSDYLGRLATAIEKKCKFPHSGVWRSLEGSSFAGIDFLEQPAIGHHAKNEGH